MKVLFIGGTGTISTAVSELAVQRGIQLYHLNRGHRRPEFPGVRTIVADIHHPGGVAEALQGHQWDAVVDWIGFSPADIERDLALFRGNTRQFIFISSASAYQKPLTCPVITESTPLCNPFWEYSRNKIACEDRLMQAYRMEGFPITIVRPSHTYDTGIPLTLGSSDFTTVERIKRGKPVVVHGDGASLWTVTHSADFAKAFVGLLGLPQAIGHAFHITSDESLTWNQIYHVVGAAVGVEPKLVHIASETLCDICDKLGHPGYRGSLLGDKAHTVIFDNTKIKRFVPDYVATIPFAQGIRRAIKWYEADASRMVIKPEKDDLVAQILDMWNRRAF